MRMNPRDALFLYLETEVAPQAFVIGYAFDPDSGVSAEIVLEDSAIREWVGQRTTSEVWRQRVVRVPLDLDDPVLVSDPHFDSNRHISIHEEMSWDTLRNFHAGLIQRPMDRTRPLWEVHVVKRVTGLRGAGYRTSVPVHSVVMLKAHHAISDGKKGVEMAHELFATDPLTFSESVDRSVAKVPNRGMLLLRSVPALPRNFLRLRRAIRVAKEGHQVELEGRKDGNLPLPLSLRTRTVINKPIGPRRRFDCVFLDLDELREIKGKIGGITVNDLILTVVSIGLTRYLDEHSEAPCSTLSSTVPLSTRELVPGQKSVNQFAVLGVDFHATIADPIERVRAIRSSMMDEKRRVTSPGQQAQQRLVCAIPGFVFRTVNGRAVRKQRRLGSVVMNTGVSSVPIGSAELEFCGMFMATAFGILPLEGMVGVAQAVTIVGSVVTINITSDADQLRDPERYVALLEDAYHELREAAENYSRATSSEPLTPPGKHAPERPVGAAGDSEVSVSA